MNRVLIKDIGKVITGNTPSKSNLDYYDSNDIFFVKPDIINDLEVTNIKYTKEYISEKARNKARIVKRDTVFVTCIGTIGKIGIASGNEFAFNQQINAIEPNDKVLPRYLAYNLLFNKKRLIDIANAPVVPIINKTQFENFSIKIDENLDKQKDIIDVLDRISNIIYLRKKQFNELDNLIKSQFIEMFGNIQNNSKNWKTTFLCDISNIKSGGTPTRQHPEYFKGNIPWITTIALGKINIDENDAVEMITEEAIRKSTTKLIPANSLLFGIRVGVGKISINTVPMCINQDIVAIIGINKKIYNQVFLKNVIDTYSEYFNKQKRGATIQGIRSETLKNINIPIVPLDFQDQFAIFSDQVNQLKLDVQKNINRLEEIFNSLMQKAFDSNL